MHQNETNQTEKTEITESRGSLTPTPPGVDHNTRKLSRPRVSGAMICRYGNPYGDKLCKFIIIEHIMYGGKCNNKKSREYKTDCTYYGGKLIQCPDYEIGGSGSPSGAEPLDKSK